MGMKTVLLLQAVCCANLFFCAIAKADQQSIYSPHADAREDIALALEKAGQENKRLLIQWGTNWCIWCHRLHEFFEDDPEAKALLSDGYEVVLVDAEANRALLAEMKVAPQGLPFLTVLDARGKKLADQEASVLLTGSQRDAERVNGFLKRWLPERSSDMRVGATAEERIAAAVETARVSGKSVFVSVGTSWGTWCIKLDALLTNAIIGPLLNQHFVFLSLDQEKVKGTTAFRAAHALDRSSGVPWYATLNGQGELIATSDAKPAQNTGYPASQEEIAWFMEVLKRSAPSLDATSRSTIEREVYRIGQTLQRQ